MAEGWIKLNRGLFDNELWISEPFSRGQAWVDLLLLANHKDSYYYKRGNKIVVKRGQLGRSCVELSDRWKWSRTKVNKFLKDLEKEHQIEVIKSSVTQLVTILNYDKFQSKEQQTEQQKSSESASKVQQKDTYKNDNNDNNVKNVKNVKNETVLSIENFNPYPNLNIDKKEVFESWINYRIEIKKKIKVESTLNNLIEKFNSNTLEDCLTAVNSSIDNQYTGLFWNNNSKNSNHGKQQQIKQSVLQIANDSPEF